MLVDRYNRLVGVHPDLVRVVQRAGERCPLNILVTEGVRTRQRQMKLVSAGASKTLNSRHLTGHAVDLAVFLDMNGNGVADQMEIRWDWPLYERLGKAMKDAAKELNIPLVWGGDWVTFTDGPHFELPWGSYPLDTKK